MDRNELVEKAARAIRSAYIEYCGGDNPVLDAQLAGDVSEWHGEAEAAVDAILPDVIEAVREEAARIAEEERDLHVAYLGSAVFADTRWEQGGIDAAESIARTIRAAVLGDALKGGK